MGMPILLVTSPTVRSFREAGLAASGQLSVSGVPARKNSPYDTRQARRGAGSGTMDHTAVAVHAALRALGHRHVAAMYRERRHVDLMD